MKRMFTWMLVLTLLLCLPLLAAAEEAPASDFEWEINDDGGVTITSYVGNGGDVVIPEQINRQRVTAIGDSAFFACDGLTSITLPHRVTSIGDDAFYLCDGLTSVTIPNRVTSIGDRAFSYCSNLTSVTIQNPNTELGLHVFTHSPLQVLMLPESGRYVFTLSGILADTAGESGVTILDYFGQDTVLAIPDRIDGQPVTTIGSSAFAFSDNLISVIIPNHVTSIGDSAFNRCTNLTSVTIPDSVTSIGNGAFDICYFLTEIHASEDVLQLVEASGFKLP